MSNRPTKFPTAWPTDQRSTLNNNTGRWVIYHSQREPMVWTGTKWEPYFKTEKTA